MRITFERGKLLAALSFGLRGTGKSGVPYKEGLIDIQAGTSDKRGTVSEPVCFRKRPRTVALKGLRARYVLSSSMLTELSPDPERQSAAQ